MNEKNFSKSQEVKNVDNCQSSLAVINNYLLGPWLIISTVSKIKLSWKDAILSIFSKKFKDPVLLFIVLVIRDGNLIMDEADIPAGVPLRPPQRPQMYVRKKRIAHAKDFQKFLKVNWFNLKFARFLTQIFPLGTG